MSPTSLRTDPAPTGSRAEAGEPGKKRGPRPGLLAPFRRFLSLLRKETMETARDWKMWSLVLSFAPFFVLVMDAYLSHATPTYDIAVVNQDMPVLVPGGEELRFGRGLMQALAEVRSEEGDTILRVREAPGILVDSLLETRVADLVIIVPDGFSRAIHAARLGGEPEPVPVRSRGDPQNPDYLMAAVWADMTLMTYVEEVTGTTSPAYPLPETTTQTATLSEFELYVPGLLALSFMMLMFTAAGALIREKDKGTLLRLRLSNLRTFEWLAAVSVTQVLLGLLALGLTLLTAIAIGYRHQGSLSAILAVGALASLSIMGISVLVAAFLRTVFDLVTVGCFPFFILMFFSGGMFPMPGVPAFELGGRAFQLNEILPTTHAITALGRVMSYGAGVEDIVFELAAMGVLTVFFYGVGVWIFTRRHMPSVG